MRDFHVSKSDVSSRSYRVLVISTKYLRPGSDFLEIIVDGIRERLRDHDCVVISEKMISTALGNILDESHIKPSFGAKFIAEFWMRVLWGYFFGYLCHFRGKMICRLRAYPLEMGSKHKQVALRHAGLLQALMFGSEGGIDASNLPYSYVSLPIRNPDEMAKKICAHLRSRLRREVAVMIVDTDRTYSLGGFHFTPRPKPIKGIHSFGGFVAYAVGRMLGLRKRATPLAVAGCEISVEAALTMAQTANSARGAGAGRTAWEMAERFKVGLTEVSWEMLETVKHKPIVILRTRR